MHFCGFPCCNGTIYKNSNMLLQLISAWGALDWNKLFLLGVSFKFPRSVALLCLLDKPGSMELWESLRVACGKHYIPGTAISVHSKKKITQWRHFFYKQACLLKEDFSIVPGTTQNRWRQQIVLCIVGGWHSLSTVFGAGWCNFFLLCNETGNPQIFWFIFSKTLFYFLLVVTT